MSIKTRSISISEVKANKSPKSTWIVIDNNVYDVTDFLSEHPGGIEAIMEVAGTDATQAFEDVGHSSDARAMLKDMKVGQLNPNKPPACFGYGYWPWALVVIAGALAVGIAVKKYYY